MRELSSLRASERIRRRLEDIYKQIGKFDPEHVQLRMGRTSISLEEVQQILSENEKTILVEYFYTGADEGGLEDLYNFVVSSKEVFVEKSRISIQRYIANLQLQFSNRARTSKVSSKDHAVEENQTRNLIILNNDVNNAQHGKSLKLDALDEFSELSISPISKYLRNAKIICFIPYGRNHYLPLHALRLYGKPIIMNHQVVYCPSASVLRFLDHKGDRSLMTCAAFGSKKG